MRKINRSLFLFCFFLLAGFLGGICLPEMIKMNSGTYAGFFSMYSFQRFQQQESRMRELFLYIFSIRIELLLFLWLSSFTKAGIWLHGLAGGWILCSAGMLLRLFLMKKGLQGVWMFFCCLMPQWLLYGIMWKRELAFCIREQGIKEQQKKKIVLLFLNLFALCTGGCLCESWIGIEFQKKIFNFFL